MNAVNCGTRNGGLYSVGQFSPFAEFEQELGRLFGGTANAGSSLSAPLDVSEDTDKLTVVVDLPGVRKEDIQIAFEDGVLTLGAERKPSTEVKEDGYLRRERHAGRYERRLVVRTPINIEGIKAVQRDGVLTVTLPKSEAAKPKQISVSE